MENSLHFNSETSIQSKTLLDTLFHTVTFTLNEQNYALDILHVRDIVMGKLIYRIPNSDPILLGVVNLRGEIIPVYSLKSFLGLTDTKLDYPESQSFIKSAEDEYLIIVHIESRLFAISVDTIKKNIAITNNIYNKGTYMNKWSKDTIFTGVIMDGEDNILMMDGSLLMQQLMHRNETE